MERREEQWALCSARKAAHGAGMGLGRVHPAQPMGERGGGFAGALPACERPQRVSEHQSCAFVLLNPQVPTGKPPARVRRISVRSFLDLHKQSEFCSALQGAAGKIFLRAGTGLPGLCAECNTLLSCCAHAWGCATCSRCAWCPTICAKRACLGQCVTNGPAPPGT